MSKYILVFDSADPYVCSNGCCIFNTDEEFEIYYNHYGVYESEKVFKVLEEMNFKKNKDIIF